MFNTSAKLDRFIPSVIFTDKNEISQMSLNPIISYSLTHKLRHSFFKLLPRLTNVEGNAPFLLSQHKIRKSKSLFSVLLDCWFLWYQRNWKTSVVKNNIIQRIWEGGNDLLKENCKPFPLEDNSHWWLFSFSTSYLKMEIESQHVSNSSLQTIFQPFLFKLSSTSMFWERSWFRRPDKPGFYWHSIVESTSTDFTYSRNARG